ncbi:uncharacterized protein LOC117319799 isoform X2 [Pecten maximus]|uniref:uncharacterized protein LOC117319799 isoform X2 n=1 Tax=Pecten maximus TaxID=6579 RepID=UPI001457F57C|nr:uncharacterized protein LOC117319799 isoform X2 [Pecten maximus]
MELVLLCIAGLFTVKASEVKTEFQSIAKTRDGARGYCQRTYYQGSLAPMQDIVNTRQQSIQVWDGNTYQLSPLITIIGCTNDTGVDRHTIPESLHWSDAAAQCQAQCNTTTLAIRGPDCHCLDESYTLTNDSDCLPMIKRSPTQNSKNTDAKTVFKRVSLGISYPPTNRCLAVNGSGACNYEFRICQDSLHMTCKGWNTVQIILYPSKEVTRDVLESSCLPSFCPLVRAYEFFLSPPLHGRMRLKVCPLKNHFCVFY